MGIQLLDAPTDRHGDPRALRYIVDHLSPGTTIQRRVLVANRSSTDRHIELYPAAATVDGGTFRFGVERESNELTSWISLERTSVELRPGDEARVRVTIVVPPRASAGERYAVVWAAVSSQADQTAAVKQVHRAGVRVYLDIGPGGEPASDFSIGAITPSRDKQGVPSLAINVTNTGARALDLGGRVTLSDGPAGLRAGPFEVVQGTTLAAGQSGLVLVRLPASLPNGPWTIEVSLESGTVKHSVTGSIGFPDAGGVGRAATLISGLMGPMGIAGVSLIIVALVALLVRRARRLPRPARH